MRIAFISAHNFAFPGGVRTHILNLAQRMEKLGHKCTIIAPKKGNQKTPFNTGIKNLVEVGESFYLPLNGSFGDISYFTNDTIYNLFEENKFDIIHFHNFLPFISSDALLLAGDSKKILTIHTHTTGMASKMLSGPTIQNLLKMFDQTIFVSPSQKNMFEDLKVPHSIIPNGISVDEKAKSKVLNNSKIKLLFVGRLDPRKGLDYLLKSFDEIRRQNKNIELHIASGGDLEKFKGDNGISDISNERIIFHNELSDKELAALRKKCDIYISPATGGESFGIVILEAMASALPVIAFDNPGYRTVLTGELKWGLVKNMDVSKLTKKIIELTKDTKKYSALSKLGLEEVKKYDWNEITDKVLNVYKSTLSN